jgi:hypothetical protein
MAAYSFADIHAEITGPGGSIPLGAGAGVAEEGLTVDPIEDKDTMTIGADGTPMHSLHMGKGARISVRLMKTSPTNRDLMAMYNFQTSSAANHGRNTLVIRDVARGDVMTARDVAFARIPTLTWSKDPGVHEWIFLAGKCDPVLGTGEPASPL